MIKKMMIVIMSMAAMASAMKNDQPSVVKPAVKQNVYSLVLVNSTNDVVTLTTNEKRKAVIFDKPFEMKFDGKNYTMRKMFILDGRGENTIEINPGEAAYYAIMKQGEVVDWYARRFASVGATLMNTKDASFDYATIARGDSHFVVMTADVGRVYSTYAFVFKGDAVAFEAIRNEMKPFIKSLNPDIKKQLLGESIAIIDQRKWKSISIADKFKQYDQIRSAYLFTPAKIKAPIKPIVLFVIHGTWAMQAATYQDINDEWFQYVLRYAQELAEKREAPIEVVSYGWTGLNATAERVAAAKSLALIISQIYNNYNIITVGHSHGCNVAIATSNFLIDKKINLMINMGVPVRDVTDQDFTPQGVEKLVSFYSTSDVVQAVGAVNMGALFESEGSVRKFQSKEGLKVYNIRTQIDGSDPTHTGAFGIRMVVHYLSTIMDNLNNFKYNNDLDMNIRSNAIEKDPVLIAVRKYLTVDKIVKNNFLINNTDTKDKLWNFMLEIKKEVDYSQKAEERFEIIYGRSIHYKASLAYRGVMGGAQEIMNKLKE